MSRKAARLYAGLIFAFALVAACLILSLPPLFAGPESWQVGLSLALGVLSVALGVIVTLMNPRSTTAD